MSIRATNRRKFVHLLNRSLGPATHCEGAHSMSGSLKASLSLRYYKATWEILVTKNIIGARLFF